MKKNKYKKNVIKNRVTKTDIRQNKIGNWGNRKRREWNNKSDRSNDPYNTDYKDRRK